jgi:hypothetical protein
MTILFLLTSIFGQQVWYFNVGDWTSTQIIEIFIYGLLFILNRNLTNFYKIFFLSIFSWSFVTILDLQYVSVSNRYEKDLLNISNLKKSLKFEKCSKKFF